MQKLLHKRATVQPGGRIEVVDGDLEVGEHVDVVISPAPEPSRRSAWQIISQGSGQRIFKSAKEVDAYLAEDASLGRADVPFQRTHLPGHQSHQLHG